VIFDVVVMVSFFFPVVVVFRVVLAIRSQSDTVKGASNRARTNQ